MNPLLFPTLLLTAILFVVGERISQRTASPWLLVFSLMAALPAVVFAAFYAKIFGEANWLYWYRALPGTELSAAGIGLLGGWLQHRRQRHPQWQRRISGFFIPFLLVICVSAPYLKQIFLRPVWNKFEDSWRGNVCLQSSESSCGPASAATLLRYFGKSATELEIAHEAFTTRRGTENWYLLRSLRRRGLSANCQVVAPGVTHLLVPAIAGVKLRVADGTGHFIALLEKSGENFIVGDPLVGREELSVKELDERYDFTGFYLTCHAGSDSN